MPVVRSRTVELPIIVYPLCTGVRTHLRVTDSYCGGICPQWVVSWVDGISAWRRGSRFWFESY